MAKTKKKTTLNLTAAKKQDKLCIDLINEAAAKMKRPFTQAARIVIEAGAAALAK